MENEESVDDESDERVCGSERVRDWREGILRLTAPRSMVAVEDADALRLREEREGRREEGGERGEEGREGGRRG